MFAKGLNNLKSQFGNGGTSAVNNIHPNIGRTNNVFKINRRQPAAKKILPRQGNPSKVTPFTVFNRPSSTTPSSFSFMIEIGEANGSNSVDSPGNTSIISKTSFQKTLDGRSRKVRIPNIL